MADDTHRRISGLETRINTLQTEVTQVTIETAKILLSLDHLSEAATERQTDQRKQHDTISALLSEHIAIDARNSAATNRWLQSLISPQTVILVLAVLAGALGVGAADVITLAAALPVTP